jgi:pimeloyl-ACP methyl ester carboxylesterase
MAASPRSRFIELSTGLRYHLLEWGDPDVGDTTCVLIHGFLDLAWGWDAVCCSGLADRFHVVAPDMRGHGDSDRVGPGGYYHFADYVADLAALLDGFAGRRLVLVGHSMGGAIAFYYAGTYPERVARLALLEGIGPPVLDRDGPSRMRSWIAGWRDALDREPHLYPDVAAAAARLRQHDSLLGEELALELADRGTRALPGGHLFKHDPLHLTRGPYPFDVAVAAEFWRAIECPVLAVEASESSFRLPGGELEERLACFKDVRRETLPGAGHMMQRHQPAALATLLGDFLARD